MKTEAFDFKVPPELIAQVPIEPRDHSKLMIVDVGKRTVTTGLHFYNLPDLLAPGDVLVFNNSRVIPARLRGHKGSSPMEEVVVLLLREIEDRVWEALVEKGELGEKDEVVLTPPEFVGKVVYVGDSVGKRGERLIKIFLEKQDLYLEQAGEPPVPPYIHKYTGPMERYQTVYSKIRGSAAAPTAGLHFTNRLLDKLVDYGVTLAFVTLHIGIDTFMPILEEKVEDHKIYTEYCEVPEETCEVIKEAKAKGNKVVCVGTTVVRALETSELRPFFGWTSKYIYPGYKFKVVENLITNFHYPKSTNLVLVSALAGTRIIKKAYKKAIEWKYRFYSFGDSMLIRR